MTGVARLGFLCGRFDVSDGIPQGSHSTQVYPYNRRATGDPSMPPNTPSVTHTAAASSLATAPRVASVSDGDTPVLLYDGECGFCAGSVQFVLAHEAADRRDALRFAPLQGAFGAAVRRRFPHIVGVDSVVWFDPTCDDARALRIKSEAALSAVAHLGGIWRVVAMLGMLVPRVVRDVVYDAIAKRRFEHAAPACLIPTTDARSRFLA